MPRAPARIRKRYIEGTSVVLDAETEETLLYGYPLVFDTLASFRAIDQWQAEWSRWRDVILPKCIEHMPGMRPVAMYVLNEIEPRELRIKLPDTTGWKYIDVRDRSGKPVRHWLNVPEPFMEAEAKYLRGLGVVSDDEYRLHRAWVRAGNNRRNCYPLEMSLYE